MPCGYYISIIVVIIVTVVIIITRDSVGLRVS